MSNSTEIPTSTELHGTEAAYAAGDALILAMSCLNMTDATEREPESVANLSNGWAATSPIQQAMDALHGILKALLHDLPPSYIHQAVGRMWPLSGELNVTRKLVEWAREDYANRD